MAGVRGREFWFDEEEEEEEWECEEEREGGVVEVMEEEEEDRLVFGRVRLKTRGGGVMGKAW